MYCYGLGDIHNYRTFCTTSHGKQLRIKLHTMADCFIILRQAVATRRRPNSTATQRRANETERARKIVISYISFFFTPFPCDFSHMIRISRDTIKIRYYKINTQLKYKI